MEAQELLAGAGKARIGLDGVLPYDGFTMERHPLCARALVLECASGRICIVNLELTSIAPALQARLEDAVEAACGCRPPYAWIVPTHTFSAPHVRTPEHLKSNGERERNERYLAAIVNAVERAVAEAMGGMMPARIECAQGSCPVNVNRDVETPAGWWLGDNDEGFSDHAMPIVLMVDAGGGIIAVVAAADVQSSVLDKSRTSEGERVVSGDLFGFAAGMVERDRGGVCLMLTGAAGDQAPRERAVTVTFDAAGTLAQEDAHEDGYRMLHQQGSALGRAIVQALDAAHTGYSFVPAGTVSTRVSFLGLGDMRLVGVEPEVASSFGAAVRQAHPGRVLLATLVNGGAKYLPAPGAYQKITYEAMNSGFAQGAHEHLLDTILAAL